MTDLLYGRNAVREALRAGRKVMRLIVAEPSAVAATSGRPGTRPGAPVGRGAAPGRGGAPVRGGAPGRSGPPGRGGKGAASGRPGRPEAHGRAIPADETRAERRTVSLAGRAPLDELMTLARTKGIPVERVPGERLDKLTN